MDEKIRVVYRDKKLEPVYQKTYLLSDYTDMIRMNLIRIISDVEDLVYTTNQHQSKQDWPDDVWTRFQHIKHKLLDNAGSIGRLPEDLVKDGDSDGKAEMDRQLKDKRD